VVPVVKAGINHNWDICKGRQQCIPAHSDDFTCQDNVVVDRITGSNINLDLLVDITIPLRIDKLSEGWQAFVVESNQMCPG